MQTTTETGSSVATDETDRLIASNKVEGTAVYNRQSERLGSVYNFMVDKRSGQVEYAVMSFGGFLGIGDSYHPLPWKSLTYDTSQGGYVVDLDKNPCKGHPATPAARRRTGATRAIAAGLMTITAPSRASSRSSTELSATVKRRQQLGLLDDARAKPCGSAVCPHSAGIGTASCVPAPLPTSARPTSAVRSSAVLLG